MASIEGFSAMVEGQGLIDLRADGSYNYSPAFTVEISVAGQGGTGEWGGTLEGMWQIGGDQLTMAENTNALTGSVTIAGQTQPLPPLGILDGAAKVLECTPATLTYELATEVGPVTHTLVIAG